MKKNAVCGSLVSLFMLFFFTAGITTNAAEKLYDALILQSVPESVITASEITISDPPQICSNAQKVDRTLLKLKRFSENLVRLCCASSLSAVRKTYSFYTQQSHSKWIEYPNKYLSSVNFLQTIK